MTLIAGVVGSVGFVYSCFVLWKKRILLAKPADILKGKAKITPPQKLLMLLPASGLCIGVGLFLRGVPDKGVAMQKHLAQFNESIMNCTFNHKQWFAVDQPVRPPR